MLAAAQQQEEVVMTVVLIACPDALRGAQGNDTPERLR